jgi:hypothetical protein
MDRFPLDAPRIGELRAKLVELLDDVRRRAAMEELRRDLEALSARVETRPPPQSAAEAERMARELAKAGSLVPLADAVRGRDAAAISREAAKLAEGAAGMTAEERGSAAKALQSAAGVSELPGLSEALTGASATLQGRDAEKLKSAMARLAATVAPEAVRAGAEERALQELRGVLKSVEAILAGEGVEGHAEGGAQPAGFFGESSVPLRLESGRGNLVVRDKPGDIREIVVHSRAANAGMPAPKDVAASAQATIDRGEIDPAYRDYVRRYFTIEGDNR